MQGTTTLPILALVDWSAPDLGWTALLRWIAMGAAFAFGLAYLALLARAWTQRGRYRAADVLGPKERSRLEGALTRAEERTTGEIVVVVLERSDAHPAAPWVAGLLTLLLGTAATARWLPWDSPALFFACQLAFGGLGMLAAARVRGFRRVFVREDRADETAQEQAFQEFYRSGLHRTVEGTGVLLFVSLFERRVIVLGDHGIDAKLDATHWEVTDAAILEGVRAGDLFGGLMRAIEACEEVLAEHFPVDGKNPNQVPNHVIVRAE